MAPKGAPAMEEKVTVSDIWHFPLLLTKMHTPVEEPEKTTAVVRVKAALEASRVAIHLVVVIDVGSSESWAAAPPKKKPSRLDLLKKAMRFIIRQLGDDGPTVHHLTFVLDDELAAKNFRISKDSSGISTAESWVDELLLTKGDTAFKPGLEKAVKILDDREDKKSLGFIVLLSDGLENSKFKYKEGQLSIGVDHIKAYAVHTFGLCNAHDPSALLHIANESKGTYSSITENLSSKVTEALAVCLGGLSSIVAVDTVVQVIAKQFDGWTTKITGIDSGGYKKSVNNDGASGNITIDVLYAGEVKDLIVHFELSIPSCGGPSQYVPLTASVKYKDAPDMKYSIPIKNDDTAFSVYARRILKPEKERSLLPFPVVLQQMVRIKVLDMVSAFQKEFQTLKKEAEDETDNGDGDQQVLLNIASNRLQRMWEKLKASDKHWKEAQRIGLDVERVENDVDAMVSGLKRGLGVGCVYSWASSHRMQRATATGLPAAAAFLTPAMKKMVRAAQKQSAAEDAAAAAGGNAHRAAPPGEGCMCRRAVDELLQQMGQRLILIMGSQLGLGEPSRNHVEPTAGMQAAGNPASQPSEAEEETSAGRR